MPPRAASPTTIAEMQPPARARRQRVDGAAAIRFGPHGLIDLTQRAPCRFLLPSSEPSQPRQATALTTSGGLTSGDRVAFSLTVDDGATASVSTQAAEKLYRAAPGDDDARIMTRIEIGAEARGEWLAQEAIVFDGARARRDLDIDLAPTARLLATESLVFGRGAMGETVRHGRIHDGWRVRRGGRLIWVDALRLDGDIAGAMRAPFAFGANRGTATVLYAGPDAAGFLETARALAPPEPVRGGATVIDGLLICRLLSPDVAALRAGVRRLVSGLRSAAIGLSAELPAVWSS